MPFAFEAGKSTNDLVEALESCVTEDKEPTATEN